MQRNHLTTYAAAAALTLFALPAVAGADTIETNFETTPAAFALGNINSQNGWLKTGTFDAAIFENVNAAVPASFGLQSLRISNAVTSGSFGDQTFSAPLVNGAGEPTSVNGGQAGGALQPHFDASFQFLSTTPGAEQPGLAVTVSPDSGAGGRMSFLRLSDTPTGIAIDFADVPSAQTDAQGHVDFRTVRIAASLDRSVAHSVRLSVAFVPGESNDVVDVYVDGQLKFTGSSWENYYRHDVEAGPAYKVPVVDQLILRASATAQPALAGKGFLIDDMSIRSYGGVDGGAGATGALGETGAAGATGQAGATGAPGASPVLATSLAAVSRPQILSAHLNRRTGIASIRLRGPASAGIWSGSVSLLNGRGVRVRRTFDLGSNESSTLRLRFATTRRTATTLKRATVKLIVFSRNQSGQAARVQRTVR
jgi:hypothetical protein